MILKMLVVGPFMSNCYVMGSEKTKEGMIIDPGASPEGILKTVEDLGLDIKVIVATHNHIDHIGAVARVKEATGAPFAIHEVDGNRAALEAMSRGLSQMMGVSLGNMPAPDRLLKDGDTITVGEATFEVLHVPGHSPGGIALLSNKVIFSGDILFQYSIGRTDFPGGSYSDLMDGIFTKLLVLPDETVVYPGHGPKTTIGTERKMNHFIREWAARQHRSTE